MVHEVQMGKLRKRMRFCGIDWGLEMHYSTEVHTNRENLCLT